MADSTRKQLFRRTGACGRFGTSRSRRRMSMARVRVVTDSAGDLTPSLAEERGVTVVPLSIRFGSEEFVDGAELSADEFWSRCKSSDMLPETSAPFPGAFQEAFLGA